MSKKKRLLGPDGKPYVAPPKPAPGGPVAPSTYAAGFDADWVRIMFGHGVNGPAAAKAPLRDAVAEQVAALTADFDGAGGAELPAPPRDLTAYADAFASARQNCKHENATETLYGREWYCETCARVLSREDMCRAGRFGWFFS